MLDRIKANPYVKRRSRLHAHSFAMIGGNNGVHPAREINEDVLTLFLLKLLMYSHEGMIIKIKVIFWVYVISFRTHDFDALSNFTRALLLILNTIFLGW